MSTPIDTREVLGFLRDLQAGIAAEVEAIDGGERFASDAWQRGAPGTGRRSDEGGGGETRVLRDGLQTATERLQYGQVLLATVGSTAPFVGLLGTVWGIYHALTGMADSAQLTIDQVAGPVGEALVMTAAGLAVALPAVLAYNWFGKRVAACEAELEGFAHDLRAYLSKLQ